MDTMKARIVFSVLLAIALAGAAASFISACGAQEHQHGGLGTSPSFDDDPLDLDAGPDAATR